MDFHVGRKIRKELRRQERTVAWFARKICCSRANAYKIFEKDNLDIKLLFNISKILGYNFFSDISEEMCKELRDTCDDECET